MNRAAKYFTSVLLLTICTISTAQTREFTIHTIAFYNLENLFDIHDDPMKFDESSPIMDFKENRQFYYNKKINNMAQAISEIGLKTTNNSPAILGVAEIENRDVLEDLINDSHLIKQNYGILHFDSPDSRGIDVALLYQKDLFTPTNTVFYPLALKDEKTGHPIYTRDQLVVSGYLDNDLIYLIVNHWPSRRGGETRSNYRRLAAAKLNKHIIDSLQTQDPYSKIISMGDFNDEPTNESFKTVLHTKSKPDKLELKELFNPMEQFYKNGFGTTAYKDKWSLFDQMILSKSWLETDYNSYRFYKAGIFNPSFLITPSGTYKGYPYRSFAYEGFTGGYSDHFPVYVYVIKEKKTE